MVEPEGRGNSHRQPIQSCKKICLNQDLQYFTRNLMTALCWGVPRNLLGQGLSHCQKPVNSMESLQEMGENFLISCFLLKFGGYRRKFQFLQRPLGAPLVRRSNFESLIFLTLKKKNYKCNHAMINNLNTSVIRLASQEVSHTHTRKFKLLSFEQTISLSHKYTSNIYKIDF